MPLAYLIWIKTIMLFFGTLEASTAGQSVLRSVVSSVSPSIVCLSETKLALVSSALVIETLGVAFADFFCLPADGTRGGILLAWRSDHIALSNPSVGSFHVSAVVSNTSSATPWWITGVYGPQDESDKLVFISELHDL